MTRRMAAAVGLAAGLGAAAGAAEPVCVSGTYPHLAMFNNEGECGTGAVVPWADRLWVITYGPHLPNGSSDKLYEITPALDQIIRPESLGGTPANRMIHRESNQLVIGPYFIDAQRTVRAIPYTRMPGRHTGNARHLADPAGKVFFATMEEGLYEVDVKTLEVRGLIRDGNFKKPLPGETNPATIDSQLPGYHGKGFYSGQGRLVYANNGERGNVHDPTIPSGALAEWTGEGDWRLVRRNQFTEVTGPGGIEGNPNPATDPLWSVGWDHRSLILMLLDRGAWHAYRLPKASHCYDGSHGWNTEWPRIRDIGGADLLMTMHGTFWRFPKAFAAATSAGIAPRSTYLKVVGDFCRWNDRVVLGCDDSAKSEFLNKRKLKGGIGGPGQSQSNLRFLDPADLDRMGPALGRGAVWLADAVKADEPSDPFLFAGFPHRSLHLAHDGAEAVTFTLEVDAKGDGTWTKLRTVPVPAHGSAWTAFGAGEAGAWIRVRADRDCAKATAFFHLRGDDPRPAKADPMFDGIARPGDAKVLGGLLYARGGGIKTLRMAAGGGGDTCFDLDAGLKLVATNDATGAAYTRKNYAIPADVVTIDEASVLIVDEKGRRWRLPKGDPAFDAPGPLGAERVCREVCTERDLLNVGGAFYELPAENAGGLIKVRPVATHNRRILDYTSYRGLLVISGVAADAPAGPHIVRSDDGAAALWVGSVDDLWKLGKPRGRGGPWKDTAVEAGAPSDAYLMTGFDRRSVEFTHDAGGPVTMRIEADVTGTGAWTDHASVEVPKGATVRHKFPAAFGAYWVRVTASKPCRATAAFAYE